MSENEISIEEEMMLINETIAVGLGEKKNLFWIKSFGFQAIRMMQRALTRPRSL